MTDKTMNAAIVTKPGNIAIQQISIPEIGEYEALVKTEICGICGTTDRHIIEGKQAHHPADWYPAVLGHEAVGKITEVGSKVKTFKVGDRVTRPVAVWPGTQSNGIYSAWGGFSEYGIVKDREALLEAGFSEYEDDYMSLREVAVPEGIDSTNASLAISLSEAASWVDKLGDVKGKTIVIGGAGMFGTAIADFTKLAGAKAVLIFDINENAIERAKNVVNCAINSTKQEITQAISEATDRQMADIFVEATGADSVFNQGLGLIKPGGTAAIYGAPVGYKYTLGMKNGPGDFSVRLISCADHLAYQKVCQLIIDKKIDTKLYHSHTWDGLEKLPEALEAQSQGKVKKGFVKIS